MRRYTQLWPGNVGNVCVHEFVLPHDKDEGKDGGEDDHGEQNQQNHQTQITFILKFKIWMWKETEKTAGGGQEKQHSGRKTETK